MQAIQHAMEMNWKAIPFLIIPWILAECFEWSLYVVGKIFKINSLYNEYYPKKIGDSFNWIKRYWLKSR